MEKKYFLVQIHRSVDGTWTKGVVVKDSLDSARQSFHAYLGAYGYGNVENIKYVACYILDTNGLVRDATVDNRIQLPEVEPVVGN